MLILILFAVCAISIMIYSNVRYKKNRENQGYIVKLLENLVLSPDGQVQKEKEKSLMNSNAMVNGGPGNIFKTKKLKK